MMSIPLNTYLLRNCFASSDVQPYLEHATVLDNQRALTVRECVLQNQSLHGELLSRRLHRAGNGSGSVSVRAIYEIVVQPSSQNGSCIYRTALRLKSDCCTMRRIRRILVGRACCPEPQLLRCRSTYGCAIAILSRILRSGSRLSSALPCLFKLGDPHSGDAHSSPDANVLGHARRVAASALRESTVSAARDRMEAIAMLEAPADSVAEVRDLTIPFTGRHSTSALSPSRDRRCLHSYCMAEAG